MLPIWLNGVPLPRKYLRMHLLWISFDFKFIFRHLIYMIKWFSVSGFKNMLGRNNLAICIMLILPKGESHDFMIPNPWLSVNEYCLISDFEFTSFGDWGNLAFNDCESISLIVKWIIHAFLLLFQYTYYLSFFVLWELKFSSYISIMYSNKSTFFFFSL